VPLWFARNPDARFEAEEVIVGGSRVVVRRVYRKLRQESRGTCATRTFLLVPDGKVAEKLAYGKG
jgi:hypothetical protein